MAGNSIGKEFTVTSFGESHGKIIGVVVDGCPAGLKLSEEDFQAELDRRIPAQPKIVSARVEKDVAKILSGVFNGFTTGAPIALMVENKVPANCMVQPLIRIMTTVLRWRAQLPLSVPMVKQLLKMLSASESLIRYSLLI